VSLSTDALGGYIELELPVKDQHWLANAYKFNSARAALTSLIAQLTIKEVWLPRYLCDSIINTFDGGKVQLKFYELAEDFTIKSELSLGEHSLLLYVNYFGVCTEQALCVISQYGANKVVIDNSQAMFCDPLETLATIYSPRKFFGLPDGGLLYSDDPRIKQPEGRDNTSETRMGHLISRLTNSPEKAYQKYLEAEQAIVDLPVLGMSELTERLMHSVDFEAAKFARGRNARHLHNYLGKYNRLNLNFDDITAHSTQHTAPLCYPFLPNVNTARRADLIKKRVFIPSYWPEVMTRVDEGNFEWDLVTNGLFLPCDQRYTEHDMDRLVHLLAIK